MELRIARHPATDPPEPPWGLRAPGHEDDPETPPTGAWASDYDEAE